MSAPIRIDGFEAVFSEAADPWQTWTRRDEVVKRDAILRACGRVRGRTLELACGNGSNTRALAERSLRLLALDGAPSAVALTRAAVPDPHVDVRVARLPEDTPREAFDLIVVAELLYYLRPGEIARLGQRLSLAPGGRLVLAHHHIDFPDTSTRPATVHARLLDAMGLAGAPVARTRTARWRVEAFEG